MVFYLKDFSPVVGGFVLGQGFFLSERLKSIIPERLLHFYTPVKIQVRVSLLKSP